MMAAARWSDSPQDNEESKHRAVTPSCEVGILDGDVSVSQFRFNVHSHTALWFLIFKLLWCIHMYLLTYQIIRPCVTFGTVAERNYNPKLWCIFVRFLLESLFLSQCMLCATWLEWKTCGFTSYSCHLDTCEASMKAIRLLNFISAVSKVLSLSENSWRAEENYVVYSEREAERVWAKCCAAHHICQRLGWLSSFLPPLTTV